mgnify:CR=1 FL=1
MPRSKKLDRTRMLARVASDTPEKMKRIAQALGYVYDQEGSAGQLLDAIASGEVIIVSTKKSISD